MMENSILRLCKELNMEDIYFRRAGYHPLMRKFSDSFIDKNRVISVHSIKRKMPGEDKDVIKKESD